MRKKKLKKKTTVYVDGGTVSVQPIEIILRNAEDFNALNEMNSTDPFKASVLIDSIRIEAYAQISELDDARIIYAGAFLREILL